MNEKTITTSAKLIPMILTALFAAILCVIGPLSVPIGPVPISLQTLILFTSIYILGTGYATVSCVLYLVLGLIGLPVFSGYEGGIGKLAGPTGGYLIGFIPMVIIGGLIVSLTNRIISNKKNADIEATSDVTISENSKHKKSIATEVIIPRAIHIVGFILATVVLYTLGTAWFVISTGTPVGAALGLCVIPFIPGDLIKIVVAVLIGPALATLVKSVNNQA